MRPFSRILWPQSMHLKNLKTILKLLTYIHLHRTNWWTQPILFARDVEADLCGNQK
jgi:hypothetical protein